MTPAIQPTARTWMLRFKNGRSTIVIHVDPTQKLESIKEELLKAVRQTNPTGQLNGLPIPDSSDDIILARAIDANDHSQGWEALEKDDEDDELFAEDKKGKGKATAGRGKGKKASDHTPSGAGLSDRDAVAFKFRQERKAGATEDESAAEDGWIVTEPTYEETYAEDNMDVQ